MDSLLEIKIKKVIEENSDIIILHWNNYFSK